MRIEWFGDAGRKPALRVLIARGMPALQHSYESGLKADGTARCDILEQIKGVVSVDLTTVCGTEVCYQVFGEGPPLVLIMGLTGSMDWWDPEFLEALSERHRVLILDNRGAGRTAAPPETEITIEQMADDTAGLMDSVGISKADVLGVSMGGMIAQELALRHPEKVNRLVLAATFCGGRESVPASREVLARLADRSGTPEEIVRRFGTLLFSEEWMSANNDYFDDFFARYIQAPCTDENAARQFMATLKFSTYDRLPQIDMTTLVTCGADDILIPAQNSRIIAQRIPGARLAEFEGAGHGFINQCRDDFLKMLEDFLSA
jgi:pimeloyl-ACP methyl ester carboxylesterase